MTMTAATAEQNWRRDTAATGATRERRESAQKGGSRGDTEKDRGGWEGGHDELFYAAGALLPHRRSGYRKLRALTALQPRVRIRITAPCPCRTSVRSDQHGTRDSVDRLRPPLDTRPLHLRSIRYQSAADKMTRTVGVNMPTVKYSAFTASNVGRLLAEIADTGLWSVICPDRHMSGKCRYPCFLLHRGSASFIAADFDSILFDMRVSAAIRFRSDNSPFSNQCW